MGTKNNPGRFDCHAAAEPDEPMFVLLGRDRLGASLTRLWAVARSYSLEKPDDITKVHDANACAETMDNWCRLIGKESLDVLRLLPYEMLLEELKRRDLLSLTR